MKVLKPAARRRSFDDPSSQAPGLPAWIVTLALLAGASVIGVGTTLGTGYGIVLLVAVALVVSLMLWRTFTLVALVAVVPFSSGLARGSVVPVLKVSEVLIFLGAALALALRPRSLHKPWTALDYAFAGYAAVAFAFGIAYMIATPSDLVADLRVVLQPLMLFLLYRAVTTTLANEAQMVVALKAFLVLSGIGAALAVSQFLDLPGVRDLLISLTGSTSLLAETGQTNVARATGLFPIWHSLAGYLLVPTLLSVSLLLNPNRPSSISTRFLLCVLALCLGGIVVSLTITIGAAVIVGTVAIGLVYRQTASVLAGLLVVFVSAAILFGPAITHRYELQYGDQAQSSTPQTIEYRFEVWDRYFVPVLEPALLSGYGNDLPDTVEFDHSENQYFTATLRGGVAMAALYVIVMAAGATVMYRSRRRVTGVHHSLSVVTAVVSVAFLPLGMVWPYFANAGLAQAWCAVAGLAVGALNTVRTNPWMLDGRPLHDIDVRGERVPS